MMPLLFGEGADSIYERQRRFEIWKFKAAHDVMLVDDIPMRRIFQLVMNFGKLFTLERRHTAAARNATSRC